MSREDEADDRTLIAFIVSICLHVALVLLLLWLPAREPPPPETKSTVALRLVDRKPKASLADPRAPGEVIDLPRPAVEEVPDKARFLSRYNTKTDRERRAKRKVAEKRAPAQAAPEPPPAPGVEPQPGDRAAGSAGGPGPRFGKNGTMPAGNDVRIRGPGGLGNLLTPTLGGAGRAVGRDPRSFSGGDVSDDVMLGVDEEGDTTLVNSRSFKYWDFFQRMRDQVRREWSPAETYRRRDPYGKVYGRRDRYTVLGVVLDDKGRILRAEVLRESGLPFLDGEAIRAMQNAGPFPNPPAGLADEKGRISFRFGFLLDLSRSRLGSLWEPGE